MSSSNNSNNGNLIEIDPDPNDQTAIYNNSNKIVSNNNNNNDFMKGFNPNLDQNIFPINDNDVIKIDSEQKSRSEPLSNESSISTVYNLNKNDSTTSKDNNAQHDKNKVTFEDTVKNDRLDRATVMDDGEWLNLSENIVKNEKPNVNVMDDESLNSSEDKGL